MIVSKEGITEHLRFQRHAGRRPNRTAMLGKQVNVVARARRGQVRQLERCQGGRDSLAETFPAR